MYCTNCGLQAEDSAKYCSRCGNEFGNTCSSAAQSTNSFGPKPSVAEKRLARPMDSKWIAGVCCAFANFFSIDVTIVRLTWVLTCIWFGSGIVAYIVCWCVIPRQETSAARTNYA